MMKKIRNKFLNAIVLLSILSAALGTFWIGAAEANLGIEICTAQGIKTIYASPIDAIQSGTIIS